MSVLKKHVLLLAVSVVALNACDNRGQQSSSENTAQFGVVSANAAPEIVLPPPPPPSPPPPPNYAPAIEEVLRLDGATGTHGLNMSRATAMRSIDLASTPTDFRLAYLEHIFAWERRIRAEQAWTQLTSRGDEREVLVGGIICAVLDCPDNPIDSRIEAEERLREEIRLAAAAVGSTFREVQRIAVRHGAAIPS